MNRDLNSLSAALSLLLTTTICLAEDGRLYLQLIPFWLATSEPPPHSKRGLIREPCSILNH